MAGTYNFTIDQNEDFTRTMTWSTGSPASPVDLIGYSALMEIGNGSQTLVTLTETDGITLGGNAGTITIEIPAVTTATFAFTTAKYFLRLTDANGTPKRLLQGTITLSPEMP